MPLILGDSAEKNIVLSKDQLSEFRSESKELFTGITQSVRNSIEPQYADFLVREASYVYPKILIKKFANLKWRRYFPVDNAGGYAKFLIEQIFNITGQTENQSGESNYVPTVSAAPKDAMWPVYEYPLALEWQYSELKLLEQTGSRLQEAKFVALRRGFEQKLNNLMLFGDAAYDTTGVLNNPNITRVPVPAGTSGSTRWAFKTPQEILDDLLFMATEMNSRSNGVFNTTKMIMSNLNFNSLIGRPRSDFSNYNLPNWVVENMPALEVMFGDAFLDKQGANKPTSPTNSAPAPTGCVVCIDEDPDNAKFALPIEMQALPVVYEGSGKITIPHIIRSAGLMLKQTQSVLVFEGM